MSDTTPIVGNEDRCDSSSGWRKSSYSMSNGQCVEVTMLEGSSFSDAAFSDGCVGIRDTRAATATGPVLRFEPRAWSAFLAEVRSPSSFAS